MSGAAIRQSTTTALLALATAATPLLAFHVLIRPELTRPSGLLLAALILPVLLLHLLRPRREAHPVSTLMFWTEVRRELDAGRPFQLLRRNLPLILQLLLILLLSYAASRPVVTDSSRRASATILILDVSGSMKTVEADGRTRFEAAREEALRRVDALRPGDRMMIVSCGAVARTRRAWTGRRELLSRTLRSLEAGDTESRLDEALTLASSALGRDRDGEIVLYSDGRSSAPLPTLATRARLHWRKVGRRRANLSLRRVELQDRPDDGGLDDRAWIFASAANHGPEPASARLVLSRDGTPLDARRLELPAGGRATALFRADDPRPGLLQLELIPSEPGRDALPADNRTALLIRAPEVKVVRLIGDAGPDIRRALETDPSVRVLTGDPAAGDPATGESRPRPQLLVVGPDAGAAEDLSASSLRILPAGGFAGVTLGEPTGPGLVDSWDRDHPLLRYTVPSDISIRRYRPLILPPRARSLLEIEGRSVAAAVRRGEREHIVLGFRPGDSNWPLRLSFPIVLRNLLLLAERSDTRGLPDRSPAGTPLVLNSTRSEGTLVIEGPGGLREILELGRGRADFVDTARAGLYTIRDGEQLQRCVVRFATEAESDIAPADALALGRRRIEGGEEPVRRELSALVLLLTLALLVVEYGVWKLRP